VEDDMRQRLTVLTAFATLTFAATPAALADGGPPANPNCFGAGASQLGQAGAMGDHASSFPTPRLGIGNVAYLLTGTHQPGELAGLLGADC
jgi:hypothetical protein